MKKLKVYGALRNLSGVSKEELPVVFFDSENQILLNGLKNGYAYSTADMNGAINVYIDDNGSINCVREKYCSTQEHLKFSTLRDTKKCVRDFLQKIK